MTRDDAPPFGVEQDLTSRYWQLTFDAMREAVLVLDPNQRTISCNAAMRDLIGLPIERILGQPCWQLVHGCDAPPEDCPAARALTSMKRETWHTTVGERWFDIVADPVLDANGRPIGVVHLMTDVTERRRAEHERATMIRLLEMLNGPSDLHELMRGATSLVRETFGCEAVGIRLRDGDDFPYFETSGFPEEFVRLESHLCPRDAMGKPIRDAEGAPLLDCMCGNVICGRFDPSKVFFTERGSFWSSCTTELLATTTDADRQARTRNRCNGEGYESVGLFALRSSGTTHGLLQINDRRTGLFTPERLALLERIADNLAMAIAHRVAAANKEALTRQRQLALDAASLGWWQYDPVTRVSTWDDGYLRIFGVSGHARPNDEILAELIHPDDLPALWAKVEAALDPADPRAYDAEYRIRRPDGRVRWIEAHGIATFEGVGSERRAVSLVGTVEDITERRHAEEALRESEERLQLLVQYAPVALAMFDRDMRYLAASRRWMSDYGLRDGEILGRSHYEVFPEITDALKDIHRRGFAGEVVKSDDDRFVRADGSVQWVRWEMRPWRDGSGGVGGIVIFSEDITERKQAEDALRTSEAKLRTLANTIPQKVFVKDRGSVFVSCNASFARDLGIDQDEIAGKTDFDFNPRDLAEKYRADDRRLMDAGQTENLEERYVTGGHELWIHTVKTPVFDAQGRVVGILGIFWDITEQKAAADALRASEARHRLLFETSRDAILIAEPPSWRFTSANPAAVRMFGASNEAELLTRAPWEYSPEVQPDGRRSEERAREADEATLRDGSHTFEWVHRRLSGEDFPASVRLTRFELDGQVRVHANIRDVTDLHRMQEQLLLAQKMESVGRLAGGVAHDFNNLLAVILNYADLALEDLPESDPLRTDVQEIYNAAQRAAALTRQLLAFSRKQVLRPHPLNLNRVVQDVQKMLVRLLGEDVELATLLADELGSVLADPGQIEQVVMNLAVNARDAMPLGGKLTIETENVDLDEDYAERHVAVAPGSYVLLSVSDNGTGMDTHTLSRVFEPFFTTKERGKGTGLGLATVYGIVKQSGGNIWVYSELGRGTTFKIYLPRTDAPAADPAKRTVSILATGDETVLLVEDDEQLRKVAERILRDAGYRVLAAGGGEEALEMLEGQAATIDLLVTDVVMPRMGGRVLAERLKEERPGLEVLYMSGYTDNAIVHHGVLDPGLHFIGKPFSAADLTRRVREVLDLDRRTLPDPRAAGTAASEAGPPSRPPTSLPALPPDAVQTLRQAVLAARIDDVRSVVAELEPAHPDVTARLRELAADFDYAAILALLDPSSGRES